MKRKSISLLEQYCTGGSLTGLKYFYQYPDKLSRCYWAVVFILSFFFATFISLSLWTRFSIQPTRINVINMHALIYDLPYPSVTVCSPVQISNINADIFQTTLVEGNATGLNFSEILPHLLGFYHKVEPIDEKQLKRFEEVALKNRYVIQEIIGKLSQSCDTFLKLCLFNGEVVPCEDLFRPILISFGVCCIFNSPYMLWDNSYNFKESSFTPRYPSQSFVRGLNRAPLSVIVDTQSHTAYNGTLINYGAIRVMINDWTEFPSEDDTFLHRLGVILFLSYTAVYTHITDEVSKMSPITRKCVFPNESDKGFKKTNYRNSDCDSMCKASNIMKRCNCTVFSKPGFFSNVCNATDIQCVVQAREYINYEDPSCDCPRDCAFRKYTTNKFAYNLQAQVLPFRIFNPFGNITLNETTAIIHVAPASSFYKIQTQETVIPLVNLLSNIGGAFGIFLGCSILSFIELLFFIYKFIRNSFQRHIGKHRRTNRKRK